MDDDASPAAFGNGPAGRLGPSLLGRRVVVRRIVQGETGPTGGPAMTDVLGVLESWADGRASVRREDGSVVAFHTADIVSGKPVPPRPSRLSGFSDDDVERRAAGMFRPRAVRPLGDWLLRYAGGTNGRPNSVLPVGDPGMPIDRALEQVADFYAEHGRLPCAQVVVGSTVEQELTGRGWVRLRPGEADSDVLLAPIAQLARRLTTADTGGVVHATELSRDWLVGNDGALANYEAVEESLRLPEAVFASLAEDGRQVARGRANLVGDWALVADLTVQPDRRRDGLAHLIMADLVDWAAERGASVMLLQVAADNAPAQALYASLGFTRHHSYRYLTRCVPQASAGGGLGHTTR